jgi:hypothetical protein
MSSLQPIESAPKNGEFIVLLNFISRELGRWTQEANGWVQPDGTPVRFSPTHWKRLLDAHRPDETEQIPNDETEQTQKRPITRLIPALVAAIFCIGGFLWIGSKDLSSIISAANLERVFFRERKQTSAAIGGFTAAKEPDNVAVTEGLESKQPADARQTELKQALDTSEARSEALARELASARKNDVAARDLAAARERENAAQKTQTELKQALDESEKKAVALARENAAQKQTADTRQTELKQALDTSEARSEALARELASARKNDVAAARERENAAQKTQTELKQALDESEKKAVALAREPVLMSGQETVASAEKPSNAEVTARDTASPTGPFNGSLEGSNAAMPNDLTADGSGWLTQSNRSQPGRPQSPRAMSSAEEAKLIARAETLIKQFDFANARLFLANALEKGSARAAFMMAETYDGQILRSLQAYGVRSDAQKAREFYQMAAAAGIEKARERAEALQPDANIDTPVRREDRSK